MDNGKILLKERRIAEQTINIFNIQPNQTGWKYPVPGGGQRWKSYDSDSETKYRWIPEKPESAALYHSPNLRPAIQVSGGACWYVSGEADVWAMHSAGIRHVLSGYGESNVIPDLVNHLMRFGVNAVYLAPDLDNTGARWARKVFRRINGSGIDFCCLQLPESLGVKGDLGKAWQEYSGPNSFEEWLFSLPKLEIQSDCGHSEPSNPSKNKEGEAVPIGYRELIANKLGVHGYRRDGNSRNKVHCPFHDDHVPSATLHREKGLYCHTCGKSYLWKDVGARLGLGSIREWSLAQHRVTPCQLSTEMREALIRNKLTNVARVYDALTLAGWEPGRLFTINETIQVCKTYGISISAIYKVTNSKEQTYSLFFPTTIVLKEKGEKKEKKSHPRRRLRLLSPQEIGRLVGVNDGQYQHYDTISPDKLANVAEYRAEVYAALFRRRPGCYPRSFSGKRLGVSTRTTQNYDKSAGIVVKHQYRKDILTIEEAANLPEERKDISGNIWLEIYGTKFAPTKAGAVRAFKCGSEVYKVEQLANYYSAG